MANALKPRDKKLILFGTIALVCIALIPVARSFAGKYRQSVTNVNVAARNVQEAADLRAIIEQERDGREAIRQRLSSRSKYGDLFSFLNRTLRQNKLENRGTLQQASNLGGSELESVELTLQAVSMNELVDLLHEIYAEDNVIAVQRMRHLKPARDGKGLDCHLVFVSPRG